MDRPREVCSTDRRVREACGVEGDGVRFHEFDRIAAPEPFRDRSRALLDRAVERESLVGEADTAFRPNRAVFDDLSAAHR
ncbi:hypothetical protein [Saccharothrix yanglingensis]|uniref:Uncharacterized protein n=1 Tax=Saccharothrix yanglingensis TaxID=659496 RepID=A0ABU0X6T9_9PSEU|nr:hypothetical protein [Saccharothrix yanglingensis]MDQ2587842.1 hypothetical protein [Saccharothrix yanglingensis]